MGATATQPKPQLISRLDAGVFMPTLPATKRKSRTCATRATDVISERKHCSRRRRHTQVELSSSRKCADKTQTIARKRWHGARKRKRWDVRLYYMFLLCAGSMLLGRFPDNSTPRYVVLFTLSSSCSWSLYL